MRCIRVPVIVLLLIMLMMIGGCGLDGKDTKVVLTTGFEENEIFRIEEKVCTKPEVMVYLTNTQNSYEEVFGGNIWDTRIEQTTLEDNVKDAVLARIAGIKVMNLLAADKGLILNEDEIARAKEASEDYYSSLNDTEIAALGVTAPDIQKMYEEYLLANKVYKYLIQDVNPEISDDEARTITVQHILIKTYMMTPDQHIIEYSESTREDAYERAKKIRELAVSGEDFDQLVAEYNEDSQSIYSFGKGKLDEAYETAAFNLGKDEISQVVETQYGYHIIKCLNTFNKEETEANKKILIEKRKEEAFRKEYDEYMEPLARNLNQKAWEEITMLNDAEIKTNSFFTVYDEYFNNY